jgi:hypothetical protein
MLRFTIDRDWPVNWLYMYPINVAIIAAMTPE